MAYSANEPTVGKSLVKPSLTFNKFVATISRQIEIASNVQGFISIKQKNRKTLFYLKRRMDVIEFDEPWLAYKAPFVQRNNGKRHINNYVD